MEIIRDFSKRDIQQLTDIYNYYVEKTIITFDHIPLTTEGYLEKLTHIAAEFPCIVFERNGVILGFAYGSKWRPKPAYNNTVESTIYLHPNEKRKQIGSKLYTELLQQLKNKKYHAVIGGISFPNDDSIKFHEKFGFKKVGHFKEVGFKFNRWVDVGFWQLNF